MTESHDIAIIGAGPIGIELAIALKKAGADYVQIDAGQIGSTIEWYPIDMLFHSSSDKLALAGVPIQTSTQQKITREEYLAYLRSLAIQFELDVHTYERVERIQRMPGGSFELETHTIHGTKKQYRADHVVLAIGAMHAARTLEIPGEDLPHVSHFFHDPHKYFGKKLLVIGGRNSAVEAAVRCHRAGAHVTISYRQSDFDPKVVKFWLLPEVRALIRDGLVRFLPNTTPVEIRRGSVVIDPIGEIPADFVLLMTGYRQDTSLFDMLGVEVRGPAREPVHDPQTMETNVPGVYIAGTAIAGTPPRKVSVIVETCHVHVPRIVQAITGKPAVPVAPGAEDD
ncbi:MAG TPA: NAD(P)-binding domain-containing protein [Thermoanaerobaculia bacterium]|nr:NAD(P)-binding domain-containing protein [Thermoanaerobaculia bacterium]